MPCACKISSAKAISLHAFFAVYPGSRLPANRSSVTVATLGPRSSKARQMCIPLGPGCSKLSSKRTICLWSFVGGTLFSNNRWCMQSSRFLEDEPSDVNIFRATFRFKLWSRAIHTVEKPPSLLPEDAEGGICCRPIKRGYTKETAKTTATATQPVTEHFPSHRTISCTWKHIRHTLSESARQHHCNK